MATTVTLPPPADDQAYCDVSALEGGELDMPLHLLVAGYKPGDVEPAPALSFLIQHSTYKKKILFDLGMRKDTSTFSPVQQKISAIYPVRVQQDVVESLKLGGLSPEDIDYACVSHIHFDHIGDPAWFPTTTFLSGAGTKALLEDGYPKNPHSLYVSDLFPEDRTRWLSPEDETQTWAPIGPFPHAHDFFGDGSLYIVDAPGHLEGHINILARTSPDGGWIFLASDSAQHWSLLTGDGQIATFLDPLGSGTMRCSHANKEQAEEGIKRVKALLTVPRVRVILAHDGPWYKENKGGSGYWPGKIPSL